MSDPLNILKYEHDKIDDIFTYFAQATFPTQFQQLFDELQHRLVTHFQVEEEMFFSILEKYPEISPSLSETNDQHKLIKEKLADLTILNPASSAWSQGITQLRLAITNYITEQENRLYALLRQLVSERELAELGRRLMFTKSNSLQPVR